MANQKARSRRSSKQTKASSSKTRTSNKKASNKTSSKKTSTTGRKKESAVKENGPRKRRADHVQEDTVNMRQEITLVFSFFLMALLMLSNFGICGAAGNIMSDFFFGLFGCVQYVLPVVFFFGLVLLFVNDYSTLAMKKCFAGFMALMMISGYVQLFHGDSEIQVYDLLALAMKDRATGGVIGGGIACSLQHWFGLIGAFLIMSCIFILSIIMVTQRSLVGFFKKLSLSLGKMMEVRREEMANRPPKEPKRKKTAEDKEREKNCEDKVKQLEEEKSEMEKAASIKRKAVDKNRKEETEETEEAGFHVPTFQPSDEVKRKDAVKELHPEIYPFTQEDGKTAPFTQDLDMTAFSFNSGKSPEEYHQDIQESIKKSDEFERRVHKRSIEVHGVKEIASPDPADNMEEEPFEGDIDQDYSAIAQDEADKEVIILDAISEEEVKEPEVTPKTESRFVEEDVVIHKEEEKKTGKGPSVTLDPKSFRVVPPKGDEYIFPPMTFLTTEDKKPGMDYDDMLKATARKLQDTLQSFGVNVQITDISFGPSVTRYEMVPEQGTKVSKIVSLTDDIKLNLAAADIRIEAPIPGKSAIGIEVPNKETMTVYFRDLIENEKFRRYKSKIAFAVGKDIGGQVVISDIAKMPHLLIAGATGSGKSVCINTLIMSILYKARPDEVKLIMIDPKMVELSIYNGIPHLLIPVVTDAKKASGALNWAVAEMTDRYSKFTTYGVRNIEGYNAKVKQVKKSGEIEEEKLEYMPQIVVIIDELADLMMVAPGEVEDAIVRLSQLARAAGIHLVIATQRPSVNVITGLIKANVPSRIAFAVSSGVDSRTIIDMNGAEKLLGRGDMLFHPYGSSKPSRIQGALITDEEIEAVVEFIKDNNKSMIKDEEAQQKNIEKSMSAKGGSSERDEYFEDAARFLLEKEKASIGMLQRMFKIGFNRAARIMDQLAEAGIVGPEEGTKPRKILMGPEQLEQYFEEYL